MRGLPAGHLTKSDSPHAYGRGVYPFRRSLEFMTDHTIDLDKHRGMSAQKATELRRVLMDVAAAEKALAAQQEALEKQLIAEPAENWAEAAEKARYLIGLYALTPGAEDPRRKRLIINVLADFDRLRGN